MSGSNSVSFIGNSDKKKDSLLLSMKLQIQYLRSLEDSERVRKACLEYIEIWCPNFYPERPDLVQEAQELALSLGGRLSPPKLSWKYAWMQRLFGWTLTKRIRLYYNVWKSSVRRSCDKAFFHLERQHLATGAGRSEP